MFLNKNNFALLLLGFYCPWFCALADGTLWAMLSRFRLQLLLLLLLHFPMELSITFADDKRVSTSTSTSATHIKFIFMCMHAKYYASLQFHLFIPCNRREGNGGWKFLIMNRFVYLKNDIRWQVQLLFMFRIINNDCKFEISVILSYRLLWCCSLVSYREFRSLKHACYIYIFFFFFRQLINI